jgi:DNA-binding transcriptional regulator YhcF (GntR family)
VKNYLKILSIDEYSITPKYLQLSNAIIRAIESGDIVKDDMLPSINDLSLRWILHVIPSKGFTRNLKIKA